MELTNDSAFQEKVILVWPAMVVNSEDVEDFNKQISMITSRPCRFLESVETRKTNKAGKKRVDSFFELTFKGETPAEVEADITASSIALGMMFGVASTKSLKESNGQFNEIAGREQHLSELFSDEVIEKYFAD